MTKLKEPYISFEELAAQFDTKPEYIKNALKNKGIIIEKNSDTLTKNEAESIRKLFSTVYKKEFKNAEMLKKKEQQDKIRHYREKKKAEIIERQERVDKDLEHPKELVEFIKTIKESQK